MNKRISINIIITLLIMALPVTIYSAPLISSVSGNISHGEFVVIKGSAFTIKTTAAPGVCDDCS